ncbi:chemotaxis protein CheB [Salinimicrobium catena]|uniref:chemotaxis protein CheB n=1 Tax=Salinimicrobium catena TaxID=390640 RepID=UPI002FE46482
MKYKAIVIGLSSGGMDVLKSLFSALPRNFNIPIVIVQHLSPRSDSQWIEIFNERYEIRIKEAEEKEKLTKGTVYLAPPNYHLLIEKDGSFSLSIDERVSYARPAIDVLFETAAVAFGEKLIGVVMTGSNHDGAAGLKRIKQCGGLTIVQDPRTAFSSFMPQEAITQVNPHHTFNLQEIIHFLKSLAPQSL